MMSTSYRHFDIVGEVSGDNYRRFLTALMFITSNVSLVVRADEPLNERGNQLLSSMEQFMVSQDVTNKWPGTQLTMGVATIYRFTFNRVVNTILTDSVNGLYDWISPDFPEDLVSGVQADLRYWLQSLTNTTDSSHLTGVRLKASFAGSQS